MVQKTKYNRLFHLHQRFTNHARLTIIQMMEDYDINRRTANRDINDLALLGVHLESETLDNGLKTWFLPASSRKITVPFNLTDLAALFMGRRLFDFSKGTLLEESLEKIYQSIETQLTRQKDFIRLKDLKRKVYVINEGPKRLKPRQVEQLDEILTGLLNNKMVKFEYKRIDGTVNKRTVAPYTLISYKRGLYLLALPDGNDQGDTRTYAIERINKAEALRGTSYKLPKDFNPETHFKNAFFLQTGTPVKVELLFSANSAPFILTRRFHHSQKIKKLDDGRLKMTLKVPAGENNFEIINWIMSFHQHVEVLAPESLRASVKKCLHTALKQYR
jgi:proteasome accessory factor B